MPVVILKSGASVLLDDQDHELVEGVSWHIYRIRPSLKPAVARIQKRNNRMFRLHLHREVAVRMRPDLVKKNFKVIADNGDYLDCRRENLNVIVAKPKRGPKRPIHKSVGWERSPLKHPKRNQPPASSLWAGGLVWRQVDQTKRGGKQRFRICEGLRPID